MPHLTDPLLGLAQLPGVEDACAGARDAVDALLWDRDLRARQAEIVAESALRGVWASAAFEGAETRLDALRSGSSLDDSPLGRLFSGTLAMHGELPELVDLVGRAPSQALARMHALVAHSFVPMAEVGRPRRVDQADDPLRIGLLPAADSVASRLRDLTTVLTTSEASGVLVAIVVHAELAVLRPFAWGSGLVARGALRLVLAQRGVDPTMISAPELGLRAAGRPRYVRALRGYASGTPEGVSEFVGLVAGAIRIGAEQPRAWS